MTGVVGRNNRAMFLSAVDMGADVVGGAPWLDPEPSNSLDFLLSIAAERGLPADLHLDETSDAGSFTCRPWGKGGPAVGAHYRESLR